MKGKFIGESTMRFRNGVTYDIRSEISMVRKGGPIFGNTMLCICIYDINSRSFCPYQSLEAVLKKNWQISL